MGAEPRGWDGAVPHRWARTTVPSGKALSSCPSANTRFTVWSGNVISFLPSGKCFSVQKGDISIMFLKGRENVVRRGPSKCLPICPLEKCRTSSPPGNVVWVVWAPA